MAMLALAEADTLMIPKDHSGSGIRTLSSGLYHLNYIHIYGTDPYACISSFLFIEIKNYRPALFIAQLKCL